MTLEINNILHTLTKIIYKIMPCQNLFHIEVNLEHPRELHELHNDYLLLPETRKRKRICLINN